MSIQVVDTTDSMATLVDSLINLQVSPPSIYIDIEGVNLGRNGSTSIVTVYVLPTDRVYLVDIHILGAAAFKTRGNTSRQSFQEVLESEAHPKVFFDVRNDSDALYSQFGVRLAGIHDVQLMELATRPGSKEFVNGLVRCICSDAGLDDQQQFDWSTGKSAGKRLFDPNQGGRYEAFNDRPLSRILTDYCAQDVAFLPRLWIAYDAKLTPHWRTEVAQKTVDRLIESQGAEYDPNGPDKARGPWPTEISGFGDDDQIIITSRPGNRPRILPYVPGDPLTSPLINGVW